MGSDEDLDLEKPAHHVKLTPFCIGATEVTVAEYKACSDRGACKRARYGQRVGWDHRAREEGVRSALQRARSEGPREPPDQLRRLGSSLAVLRGARPRRAPPHRGRVGVRRARSRRPQVPVGRRFPSAAAPERVRPRVRRLGQGERRPRDRDVPGRRRLREHGAGRAPFRRAGRATGSLTSSATCGSGSPTGTAPTRSGRGRARAARSEGAPERDRARHPRRRVERRGSGVGASDVPVPRRSRPAELTESASAAPSRSNGSVAADARRRARRNRGTPRRA